MLLVVALAAPLAGCGGDDYKMETAQVSGVLTCQGKPVPNAMISFNPQSKEGSGAESGKSATGTTDEQGKYTLTTYDLNDGALVGTHTVTVSLMPAYNEQGDFTGPANPNATFPCRGKTLTVEVKPEKNTIPLEL